MPADEPSVSALRPVLPITVIGGYLGAGKTTLLNRLLAGAGGLRLGVIVNDFGDLGIDAALLAEGAGGDGIVNLPNGCVCCTLGGELHEVLIALAELDPPLDHVVVEASGVADPVATAAWGTVAPFAPGGVVVLAAADTLTGRLRDRYVGTEVRRQLVGADLVALTKLDVVDDVVAAAAHTAISAISDAPVVEAIHGELPVDLVLGGPDRANRVAGVANPPTDADDRGELHRLDGYIRWRRSSTSLLERGALEQFLADLPAGVLRLKGFVGLVPQGDGPGEHALVQVVGSRVDVVVRPGPVDGVRLEAIGIAGVLAPDDLDTLADRRLTG